METQKIINEVRDGNCEVCGKYALLDKGCGSLWCCETCFYKQEDNKPRPQKKYKVSLTRYPEKFDVEATSQEEAIKQAKEKFPFSVWESEVEEIKTEDSVDKEDANLLTCYKCGDKMREGDSHLWYHGDQDDLICTDCATITKHTDTCCAGLFVKNN